MDDLVNSAALETVDALKKGLWLRDEVFFDPTQVVGSDIVTCFLNVNIFKQHAVEVSLLLLLVLFVSLVVAEEIIDLPAVLVVPEILGLVDMLGGILEIGVKHEFKRLVNEFKLYFLILVELVG